MEMVMTVSVVLLMFALVIPAAREIVNKTRSDNVVVDLEKIQTDISDFMLINRRLPDSLTEIYGDIPRDPWGNEFNYLNIADGDESVKFKVRKYKFIKNLNSDYDLFSEGIDGESVQPLTGKSSHDDIVRAKNGLYIGPVEELMKSIHEE
ncbi:MAG TPA: prepilin-type cleavage/methylation domain-containing protein [Gammaproteobacteria bacterium]